jgi:hypothetical protein
VLTKSREWEYEREWRILGPIGLGEAPIVKSVIFGLRCPAALQYIVVRGLKQIAPGIRYWKMQSLGKRFSLKRVGVDPEDVMHWFPRASMREFEPIDGETMLDSPGDSTP